MTTETTRKDERMTTTNTSPGRTPDDVKEGRFDFYFFFSSPHASLVIPFVYYVADYIYLYSLEKNGVGKNGVEEEHPSQPYTCEFFLQFSVRQRGFLWDANIGLLILFCVYILYHILDLLFFPSSAQILMVLAPFFFITFVLICPRRRREEKGYR